MKPLILAAMTVIGLFGIIGTVEYAHAHEVNDLYANHKNHIHLDTYNICEQEIKLEHGQYLLISKNDTDYFNEINIFLDHQIWEHSTNKRINAELERYGSEYYMIKPNGNNIEHIMVYDKESIQKLCEVPIYQEHNITNQHFINLIAETFNLEIPEHKEPTERTPIDKWKERYNTCFENKENIKTELEDYKKQYKIELEYFDTRLSDLQAEYDDTEDRLEQELRIYKQNLTDAEFTINKLKQEKAQLIKQVETLETQLSEN